VKGGQRTPSSDVLFSTRILEKCQRAPFSRRRRGPYPAASDGFDDPFDPARGFVEEHVRPPPSVPPSRPPEPRAVSCAMFMSVTCRLIKLNVDE
jgi:hypothetical protein